ncbi:hypothetical protein Plhal304r1_c013g0050371 [Plasmopara halstedii]
MYLIQYSAHEVLIKKGSIYAEWRVCQCCNTASLVGYSGIGVQPRLLIIGHLSSQTLFFHSQQQHDASCV